MSAALPLSREIAARLLPLVRLRVRVEVTGALPSERPLLLVANRSDPRGVAAAVSALPESVSRGLLLYGEQLRGSGWALLAGETRPINRLAVEVGKALARSRSVLVWGCVAGGSASVQDQIAIAAGRAHSAGVPVVPIALGPPNQPSNRYRRAVRHLRIGTEYKLSDASDPAVVRTELAAAVQGLVAEETHTWWEILRDESLRGATPEPPFAAPWRRRWVSGDPNQRAAASDERIWRK